MLAEDCVIRAGARHGVTSATRLPRDAPVRMMTEGVGETSSLADALGFCAVDDRASKTRAFYFLAGRLEALVASAPIFRPLHSLLDLAGGLGFLPFSPAFLLTFARGQYAGAWRLLRLGLLLFRRGRLRG